MPANLMRFSGFDEDAKKRVLASPDRQRFNAGSPGTTVNSFVYFAI